MWFEFSYSLMRDLKWFQTVSLLYPVLLEKMAPQIIMLMVERRLSKRLELFSEVVVLTLITTDF